MRQEKCQHQMKCGDVKHTCMFLAFHGDFDRPHMCVLCTTAADVTNLMIALSNR